MHILPILLALSTTSCVLQIIDPGKHKESWRGVVPAGCVEQLDFVREDVKYFLDEPDIVHKHYNYKDKQGCETSVVISHNVDFKKDAVAFMDAKEITCGTANDGGLILSFPRDKDKKYPQAKFPCNTKEIAIAKLPTIRAVKKLIAEAKPSEWHKHRKDNEYYKYFKDNEDNEEQVKDGFWWRLSDFLFIGFLNIPINFASNWGDLFSDYYRTFRKPILGGLAIVYSDKQGILRNNLKVGTFGNTNRHVKEKGHPYKTIGVNKKGVVAYHIMVDNKGKKQMLYPQN